MTPRFSQACRSALVALSLAATGLAHAAANDFFLQITGVPGASTDDRHKDWIDIDSFSWGLTLSTSNSGGGAGVGKPVFSDLSWIQSVDISTPKWFEYVAGGKHIETATLDVVARDGGGAGASFFQMIFSDTTGTGLRVNGAGSSLFESASMSSGSAITLRYRPQTNTGALGDWVEGVFDVKSGKAGAVFSGDSQVLLGLFKAGGDITFDSAAIAPVPEPANAVLLLSGLAALWLRRRRAG